MDTVSVFPARIITRATGELPASVPGEAVVFSAEISSDRLDSYFTHMSEGTLLNFANDARAGVSFQDSHQARRLGFGQSFDAVLENDGEVSRVLADFYTVPGINFGGQHSYASTDDFIRAVKAGLARDVSVGFYGGDMVCDICGNSFYDWQSCAHWPGVEYAVGNRGESTVIATFTIENARLSEVSAVYDGATPGAMILRAQQQHEAGLLTPETARILEVKYRIKLPGKQVWTGIGDKRAMADKPEQNELDQVRAILAEVEAPGEPAEGVRWLVDQVAELNLHIAGLERQDERIAELEAEVTRLQPLADEGNAYRADLIEQALAEGVRAMGNQFPEETYRGMLAEASLEHIKRIRDSFAEQARAIFNGGRQSVDQIQEPPQRTEPETPDLAYAG